jgi:signal transduction histidine kinase
LARRLLRLLSRSAGSTPVRQAIGLVAVFAVVNLVTLGLAYVSLRNAVEQTMQANLAQLMAGFEVAASPRAAEVMVMAAADAVDPAHRVFAYVAPDGRVTGNADARLTSGGVEIRQMPEGRPLGRDGYMPLIRPMAGGVLIIGESRTPIRDLGRTFLGLLALSLGPTVLISLGLGAVLAARARARVERIEATLARLSEGALDARIPADPGRADDLARIGARINRMAGAQEAATEALRQVSADIAHDLKTPLQRMTVLLNDLRDGLADGSREAGLADRALAEAEGAVAVFHGLLRIAQIEGGGARVAFAPVDLNALASGIAELYGPDAEAADRRLTLDLAAPPLIVSGERGLLGQALANLIENALRHTQGGTAITLRTARENGGAVLEVADRGPGIPEAEREKVLRRLYRLERSRTTPGHGLGLSLVAATARLHGAELALLDNAPGLRVRLSFPAA